MPRTIHTKRQIKPSACQATHYNGTRNKSITSSLARKGLNLLGITALLSLLMPGGSRVSAASVLHFAIDANPSITITLQNSNGNNLSNNSSTIDIAPTDNGTFNSKDVNILVGTNNYNGYSLYVMANDTALKNSTIFPNQPTYTIDAIPSKSATTGYTEEEFRNSSDTLNKWGYKISSTNLSSDQYKTDYNPIATTNTLINSNTTFTESPDTTTLTFGAKLNNAIPSGTYDTTIVFIATANTNPTCYDSGCTITYDSNGVNSATKMGNQTITAGTSTTMLWPSNFTNPSGTNGYGFAGWNTKADGTGTNYGPMESIDPANIYAGNVTLYANWVKSTGTMQGWNGCGSLSVGQVTALTDNRDNNVYAVAKLADSKCWMVENLRLGDGIAINSNNTNNPTSEFGGSLEQDNSGWCTSGSASCNDANRVYTLNTTSTEPQMSSLTQNIYSYGNYYNWYTATAGHGKIENNSKNDDTLGDICPASWRLPRGGSYANTSLQNPEGGLGEETETAEDNDILWLIHDATSGLLPNEAHVSLTFGSYISNVNGSQAGSIAFARLREYPYNIIAEGLSRGGILYSGHGGFLWTSTNFNNYYAYRVEVSPGTVIPGTGYSRKYDGNAIRCLAR